jgi:hypothetical protein
MICSEKNLYVCGNYVMLGNIFYMSGKIFVFYWQVFGMSQKNFLVCPEKCFWYVPKIFFGMSPPPPPLANIFGEKY